MITSIKIPSPAKINWLLRVGTPRPDGFHDIYSIMQTLALTDLITMNQRNDDKCNLSGFPPDIPPDKNLVFKAWKAMRKAFPRHIAGVDIHIEKQLPQGGGLGGGSSNAATVIQAIAELFQIPTLDYSDKEEHLRLIASTIGSDIPFFIPGGCALVTGRGEHVHPLPPAPTFHLVLIFPKQGMSTPEAYCQLDAVTEREPESPSREALDKFTQILMSGDPQQLAQIIENDFERVSTQYDWFLDARQKLEHAGVLRAFLCGSGSTVAGLCPDKDSAIRIATKVGGLYTYTVRSPATPL